MLDTGNEYEYTVSSDKIKFFSDNGFVVLEDVVSKEEIDRYVRILKQMLSGQISTQDKRGDLGGHTDRIQSQVENTVQITHPYMLTSKLDYCEHFRKGEEISNQLYGGASGKKESFGLDCS